MGVFVTIFIVVMLVGIVATGAAFVAAGRLAAKGVRRLKGWAQRKLPHVGASKSIEAEDVVVEDVENEAPSSRRPGAPVPPAGARSTRAQGPAAPRANSERDEAATRRTSYEYLNVRDGDSAEDVDRVLKGLLNDPVVGSLADAARSTLTSSQLRRKHLVAVIDETFAQGSLSWGKFSASATTALDAILQNSAQIANRLQAFDSLSYLQLMRQANSGRSLGSTARNQRWQLLQDELAEVAQIEETNEALLLELDKLGSELTRLAGAETSSESESILDEIHRLANDTHLYQ